jgi:hypothetical protein
MTIDHQIKHLEIIQGVVNRLSTNSFLLKGWSVVTVAALLTLATEVDRRPFAWIALLPALGFWFLDGYFLWQERMFRSLYDRVRTSSNVQVDFSMNLAPVYSGGIGWFRATTSITLLVFHGTLIISIIGTVAWMWMQRREGFF